MDIKDLQRRIGAVEDGRFGPASRKALLAHFTNKQANAITARDIADAAARLGVSVAQVRAVRTVEAAGAGYDKAGMPKILYERTGSTASPPAGTRPHRSASRRAAATRMMRTATASWTAGTVSARPSPPGRSTTRSRHVPGACSKSWASGGMS